MSPLSHSKPRKRLKDWESLYETFSGHLLYAEHKAMRGREKGGEKVCLLLEK